MVELVRFQNRMPLSWANTAPVPANDSAIEPTIHRINEILLTEMSHIFIF
jgi:hypothetical protein